MQSLDLVGFGSTGGIAQTFLPAPGQKYTVSFEYGNNPGPGVPSTVSALVTIMSGANTLLSQSVSHNTSTTSNFNWTAFSGSFIATGASATLAFNETLGGANGGVYLDAVSINAAATRVTEPSTLALFGAGIMGLGACAGVVGRRRRKGHVFTESMRRSSGRRFR